MRIIWKAVWERLHYLDFYVQNGGKKHTNSMFHLKIQTTLFILQTSHPQTSRNADNNVWRSRSYQQNWRYNRARRGHPFWPQLLHQSTINCITSVFSPIKPCHSVTTQSMTLLFFQSCINMTSGLWQSSRDLEMLAITEGSISTLVFPDSAQVVLNLHVLSYGFLKSCHLHSSFLPTLL